MHFQPTPFSMFVQGFINTLITSQVIDIYILIRFIHESMLTNNNSSKYIYIFNIFISIEVL